MPSKTLYLMKKLKEKETWEEGEEGDVSSYWMTSRKREDNEN
jgi:hypothetical protein